MGTPSVSPQIFNKVHLSMSLSVKRESPGMDSNLSLETFPLLTFPELLTPHSEGITPAHVSSLQRGAEGEGSSRGGGREKGALGSGERDRVRCSVS